MGIVNTIIRSRDDLVKPKQKSYWGCDLDVEVIDVRKVTEKVKLLPSEKRAVAIELSGKEPVEEVIILRNKKKNLGRLTTNQVKEILDDIGFNVDVILGEKRLSDFSCVMNIGGYAIPGWVWVARFITKMLPSSEKLLLSKLAPGKDRLHLRVFENNDGSWLVVAHTDHNWMSINLAKVYHAHFANVGAGDYITGVLMMASLLQRFNKFAKDNKIFHYREAENVVKWAYYKSWAEKMGKFLKVSPALVV